MDFKKKLLCYYLDHDKNITVTMDGPVDKIVKQSVISCFVPVMKTSLETKVGLANTTSIHITDFDADTVHRFFDSFDEEEWPYYQWKEIVKLIKISHFYQATDLLTECYKYGQHEITTQNYQEAVQLMSLYDFKEWNDEICSVLVANPSLFDDDSWQDLLTKHSKPMAFLLDKFVKHSNKPEKIKESSNTSLLKCASFGNIAVGEDDDDDRLSYLMSDRKLNFKSTLLEYYLAYDNDVIIVGDGYRIAVKEALVNCFVPVIKSSLEESTVFDLNEDEDDAINNGEDELPAEPGKVQRTYTLLDFEEAIVKMFFGILKNGWPRLDPYNLKNIGDLLKLSKYFRSDVMMEECYKNRKRKISKANYEEAVEIMEENGFNEWFEKISKILKTNPSIMNENKWTNLLSTHSKTMVFLLDHYVRVMRETEHSETADRPVLKSSSSFTKSFKCKLDKL